MFGLKPSKEKSERTLALINGIFSQKVQDAQKYTVAYAYYSKSGFFTKTMYSYVIGFSEAERELVVIPIDSDANVLGEPLIFNKSNAVSIKTGLQGDTILKANGLEKDLRFMVPGYTPPALENAYVLPVEQIDAAVKFKDFVKGGFN